MLRTQEKIVKWAPGLSHALFRIPAELSRSDYPLPFKPGELGALDLMLPGSGEVIRVLEFAPDEFHPHPRGFFFTYTDSKEAVLAFRDITKLKLGLAEAKTEGVTPIKSIAVEDYKAGVTFQFKNDKVIFFGETLTAPEHKEK